MAWLETFVDSAINKLQLTTVRQPGSRKLFLASDKAEMLLTYVVKANGTRLLELTNASSAVHGVRATQEALTALGFNLSRYDTVLIMRIVSAAALLLLIADELDRREAAETTK